MKKLKLVLLVIGLLVMGSNLVNAQTYRNAIGIRFAWDAGLTFKHFMNESAAFEIIASRRGYVDFSYTRLTGLYLIHNPIKSVEGLQWYYGGGASILFYSGSYYDTHSSDSKTILGLMGALGLDYKFKDVPIALSVDWLPGFFFASGNGTGFAGDYGALAARYTF